MPPTARSRFVSAFRSAPLAASGQDEWRESEVAAPARRARPGRRDHCRRRRGDPERRHLRDPRSGRAAAADRAAGAALAAEPAAAAGGRRRAPRQLLLGRVRRLALERPGRRPAELRLGVRRRRDAAAAGRWSIGIPDPAATTRRSACSTARARSATAPCCRFEVFVKRPPVAVAGAGPGGRAGRDRSPSTAPARSPASGRSPATSGISTTAAAPRAQNAEPRVRRARPLHRDAAGRGRQRPPCNFSTDSADRAGQRAAGRGRRRGPARRGRRDRDPRRPAQLRRRRRDRRLRMGSGRRHDAVRRDGRSTPTTRPAPTSRR